MTDQQPQSLISFNTTAPEPPQQPQQAAQQPQTPQTVQLPMQMPNTAQQPPQAPQQQGTNAYETIIEQQQQQINALMQQTNALNAQITQMVNNGAQFGQQPQPQQQQQSPQVGQNWAVQPQYAPVYEPDNFMPASLAQNVDVSLESLASEIGKKL